MICKTLLEALNFKLKIKNYYLRKYKKLITYIYNITKEGNHFMKIT